MAGVTNDIPGETTDTETATTEDTSTTSTGAITGRGGVATDDWTIIWFGKLARGEVKWSDIDPEVRGGLLRELGLEPGSDPKKITKAVQRYVAKDNAEEARLAATDTGGQNPGGGEGGPDVGPDVGPADGAGVATGAASVATESIQSELIDYWVDHFGSTPTPEALKNINAVLAGKNGATIDDFKAWTATQKGWTPTEDEMPGGGEQSQLEKDKEQAYYDIWGYLPPKGYMDQFADMNPLEFQYYERSKPEFQKTQLYREEREEMRSVKDEIFGTVRQDNNRFGAFDSTANWQKPRATGFLGMKPEVPAEPKMEIAGDPTVFGAPPAKDDKKKPPKKDDKPANKGNGRSVSGSANLQSNPGKPNARKG